MGPEAGETAGEGSPQESAGVPANARERARKKANRERLTFIYWWRRRELNPRPQVLRPRLYMLSLVFGFNRLLPDRQGRQAASPLILATRHRASPGSRACVR